MNIYTWNTEYATEYTDQNGDKILFNPTHAKGMGTMETTHSDGRRVCGEYSIREENETLYLWWDGSECIFSPSDNGFDLLPTNIYTNRFTRTI